ncbi:hypothetical protein BpHYR1_011282 [Brachionus plicatilis]|uniref:Uncharacterized protein n=1 Tax=Brachionus plicatilis TaxID=10195 RepID=A0A3M7QSZ5_BRAPC|nr:hypothetical protein BpHYR1_011282 [Brachionus plicatilis]
MDFDSSSVWWSPIFYGISVERVKLVLALQLVQLGSAPTHMDQTIHAAVERGDFESLAFLQKVNIFNFFAIRLGVTKILVLAC